MKLEIKGIHAAGDLSRERIVLEAVEDVDIGRYAVMAARRGPKTKGLLGGVVPYCFWLPDKPVAKGDLVVLYTKAGEESSKKNEGANTSFFFYWGLTVPIWLDDKYALIAQLQTWKGQPVADEKITPAPPLSSRK